MSTVHRKAELPEAARMNSPWILKVAGRALIGFPTREAAEKYATEPTEQGNQYVIPGCERDKSRGPEQPDLF